MRQAAPMVSQVEAYLACRRKMGFALDIAGEQLLAFGRFADESGPWLDGLSQRLDIANVLARRVAADVDPREMLEEALGPIASNETRQAITRAESRQQALALLFMAPEFQRR